MLPKRFRCNFVAPHWALSEVMSLEMFGERLKSKGADAVHRTLATPPPPCAASYAASLMSGVLVKKKRKRKGFTDAIWWSGHLGEMKL